MFTMSQSGNFGGTLADGVQGQKLALAMTGPGVLTLSGSNSTYSGGTTLAPACWWRPTAPTGRPRLGPVTLNGGTLTVGAANGTILGPVQGGSGPHTIAPATASPSPSTPP